MRLLHIFMMLISTCLLTFGSEIRNVKGTTCEIQLGECEQNLDPIYHQPAELVRSWQNCRISFLEEKVRVLQCEQKNNELQNKINMLEAKIDAISKEEPVPTTPVSEVNPGVEGQWVVVQNGAVPSDAMSTLADGKTKSHFDYVGRTKLTENPEAVVPCRTYDKINCYYTLGNSHGFSRNFEVLTNKQYKWKWTNSSLPIPNNAIIGGHRETTSNNRELLYIGRALHDQFVKQGYSENELLMGEIGGNRRELVHVAWGVQQTKTAYQILVSS